MKIAAIIPAHNEEHYIEQTLRSLVEQSYPIHQIIVVNDHSTDDTSDIVEHLMTSYPKIQLIHRESERMNVPGSKVVKAFNQGLQELDLDRYDVVCKFDADLIFPKDYIEQLVLRFRESDTTGMVAGHCSILKNGSWELEDITNKDHIRGALKAYRVECFKNIGGLKESIGWDSMDEMLARFYGWTVITIEDLYVKHLKPTGHSYNAKAKYLQGEAFYKMRYGYVLTAITAFKIALQKRQLRLIYDYLLGYIKAQRGIIKPLITNEQGKFIRSYRWRGIATKLGL